MSPGIVAESDLTGNLKSEYVFFDGERVARKDFPGNSVFYYFSDHLKTASVITDSAGTVKEDEDYYPWGGELQFVNNDSNHYKFTSKERDSETGLDYFGARYYGNWLGRFITPDWAAIPEPVPYADLDDPQSLNQYSYVRNVPTSKADVDGHDPPDGAVVAKVVQVVTTTGEVSVPFEPVIPPWGWLGPLLGGAVFQRVDNDPAIKAIVREFKARSLAAGRGGLSAPKPGQLQLGQGRGVDEDKSQSDDAKDRARTSGGLVKPARGPGSVPKDQRDPKRFATDKDKAKMRADQNGNCPQCGKPLSDEKGIGHHDPVRHADGGSEMKLIHEKCHSDLHYGH